MRSSASVQLHAFPLTTCVCCMHVETDLLSCVKNRHTRPGRGSGCSAGSGWARKWALQWLQHPSTRLKHPGLIPANPGSLGLPLGRKPQGTLLKGLLNISGMCLIPPAPQPLGWGWLQGNDLVALHQVHCPIIAVRTAIGSPSYCPPLPAASSAFRQTQAAAPLPAAPAILPPLSPMAQTHAD